MLYKLALDMAEAATPTDLGELVVDAVFRATPAEVGAVLVLKEAREFEPLVYRSRGPGAETYHKVSNFVSHEVLSSRQAVLAENVALDKHLKNRDSIAELKVASLICAPVIGDDVVLGLLHLYRTSQDAPEIRRSVARAAPVGAAEREVKHGIVPPGQRQRETAG